MSNAGGASPFFVVLKPFAMPIASTKPLSTPPRIEIFDTDGTRLTPTTPRNSRRLLRDGAAQRIFRDGVFAGIQLTKPLGSGRSISTTSDP
ncbi:MAG: hypothetical protein EAZ30_02880 [Betaproteobacteria bacterium]|nr:MAG: hypothetical protein EAZ30_02880 [Betaproteobacteria bacterium]